MGEPVAVVPRTAPAPGEITKYPALLALQAKVTLDPAVTDASLDARFAALAQERIQRFPLRYYVRLPLLRMADMWLRPRTELLPSDPRWWEFDDVCLWSAVAVAFGVINLLYVGAAAFGFMRRALQHTGLLLLFLLLRTLFLGSIENPEPRYTLECYPVVILAAAACCKRHF